jgi:hypothetical protein
MTTLEQLPDTGSSPPRRGRSTTRWIALAVASIAALVAVVLVVADDDGDDAAPAPTTATTATGSTATVPTTEPTPQLDARVVVFPDATTESSYDDPVEVTRAFAVDLLGFVDPVIGEYRASDDHAGTVDVRPTGNGPATSVSVRQRAPNDDWWVVGASTPNIDVRVPAALDEITSPVRLRGVSTAFEANVSVEVRQDSSSVAIGQGFVMGGSNGDMGPFDGALVFSVPSTNDGIVILSTRSMEDGRMWEASVVRVHFAVTSPCGGLPAPDSPTSEERAVSVFFTCGSDVDAAPLAFTRIVPRTPGVLQAALEHLLAGPTDAELAAGLTSWFSAATAGFVHSVNIAENGAAVVDFGDLRPVIPNASASAGSQLLLSQLDATVFQFPTVESVVYRIDGDCEAFTEWLQLGGCDPRTRPSGS